MGFQFLGVLALSTANAIIRMFTYICRDIVEKAEYYISAKAEISKDAR
jgi:hypothetical protein